MRHRKSFSLIIGIALLSLLVSLLVACGGQAPAPATEAPQAEAPATEAPVAATEEAAPACRHGRSRRWRPR